MPDTYKHSMVTTLADGIHSQTVYPTTSDDGRPLKLASSNGKFGVYTQDGHKVIHTEQGQVLYVQHQLPAAVRWGRAQFSFADVGSTDDHTFCMASANAQPDLNPATVDMGVHYLATQAFWAMTVYSNGVQYAIDSGLHTLPTGPGVFFDVGYEILDAQNVIYKTPDGIVRRSHDSAGRFGGFNGSWAFTESRSPAVTDGTVLLKSMSNGDGRAPSDLFA